MAARWQYPQGGTTWAQPRNSSHALAGGSMVEGCVLNHGPMGSSVGRLGPTWRGRIISVAAFISNGGGAGPGLLTAFVADRLAVGVVTTWHNLGWRQVSWTPWGLAGVRDLMHAQSTLS